MILLPLLQKLNIKTTLIGLVFLILTSTVYFLYKNNTRLQKEVAISQSNAEAYQGIISGNNEQNRVLKLEIDELSSINDSLLQKSDSLFKELVKTKAKLASVSVITQTIKETVHDTISIMLPDSMRIIKKMSLNDLTDIAIDIKRDTIKLDLNIRNELHLWVYIKRQYKNKNKTFCKRLFTFDFKKINVNEYKIYNTNPLIQTGDVRVVEIVEK